MTFNCLSFTRRTFQHKKFVKDENIVLNRLTLMLNLPEEGLLVPRLPLNSSVRKRSRIKQEIWRFRLTFRSKKF